ncbi:ABC transporter substrate-binding protein [Candidatus Fokinia crypta]|uniref:ABC transporter substrate binding protein n=1 Tax=Candidatus Fokinia crypta TaxID=1920990 RepID=A0ABZ0UPF4_9RICK|nr:ABC transporter substrate binding protein [Candidatus Fokinia cryptica]WPX98004.1 ABC transporter substrate binding protein [Candidatus Fokinia cryptica]
MIKRISFIIFISATLISSVYIIFSTRKDISRVVTIASCYGAHIALNEVVDGMRIAIAEENNNAKLIKYKAEYANFDRQPNALAYLHSPIPSVIATLATVTQSGKRSIREVVVIFASVNAPVKSTISKNVYSLPHNIIKVSEGQNIESMLEFAKKIMPNAKRVGILYSANGINKVRLLEEMRKSVNKKKFDLVSYPVTSSQDIQMQLQKLKDNIDFLYVKASGVIQPSLPMIAQECKKLGIPIINSSHNEVVDGYVLASFGVNYKNIGIKAARLAINIFKNKITPMQLKLESTYYTSYINEKQMEIFKIDKSLIPDDTIIISN